MKRQYNPSKGEFNYETHQNLFYHQPTPVFLFVCQSGDPVEMGPSTTINPSPAADGRGIDEKLTPGTRSLQKALSEAGANVVLEGSIDQPFFSTPGQIISVNGEPVQVFEYTDPALTDVDAGGVSPDGTSIGTRMSSLIGSPHFFRAEQMIALYVGVDPGVLDLLYTS